ncbi:MAG: hypothetical protein JST26_17365 [Bacteroidetes bacterium]|nr:hypothetical protein [Bacteroidota bacterium]
MDRRKFIKRLGLAGAGVLASPYILPANRLFAQTGTRKVNHVVFCLFAGGVRNFESMQKAEGNLMPNMLSGTESISADIAGAMEILPSPAGLPLQNYGTLFKEFRYASGPTGHFNGHTTAMTGVYTTTDLNIKERPATPTIFEFYRKHNTTSQSALNSWWISDALGAYPALNYSKDLNYGPKYGANFLQPLSLLNYNGATSEGYVTLAHPREFNVGEKQSAVKMREHFDGFFGGQYNSLDAGIVNTDADADHINLFIKNILTQANAGAYTNPWNLTASMSSDLYNMYFAEQVIQEFKPELLVVNMQGIDICHSNFTQYCNNIRKADYALATLWNTIQSTPGMANDTVLIVAPEHGRNLNSNSIVDAYGRYALDHTSDATSREIFCMMLGPAGVIKQNQVISTITGESVDIIPTIADLLGFYDDIPMQYKAQMGRVLTEAYV